MTFDITIYAGSLEGRKPEIWFNGVREASGIEAEARTLKVEMEMNSIPSLKVMGQWAAFDEIEPHLYACGLQVISTFVRVKPTDRRRVGTVYVVHPEIK